jgi:hypothetical protein
MKATLQSVHWSKTVGLSGFAWLQIYLNCHNCNSHIPQWNCPTVMLLCSNRKWSWKYSPSALVMHPEEQEPSFHSLQPPGTTFTGGFFFFTGIHSPPWHHCNGHTWLNITVQCHNTSSHSIWHHLLYSCHMWCPQVQVLQSRSLIDVVSYTSDSGRFPKGDNKNIKLVSVHTLCSTFSSNL